MSMTENEAIKKAISHFECMKNDAVVVLDSGFGTHPGESDLVYRNRKMYAELAINALEKQIPKKPIERISLLGLDKGGKCPTCNKHINTCRYWMYCECGQKIDWSDSK